MMVLDSIRKKQKEYWKTKDIFDNVGFEIIGSKTINDETIYFTKKRTGSS